MRKELRLRGNADPREPGGREPTDSRGRGRKRSVRGGEAECRRGEGRRGDQRALRVQ
jgi:hypothetical protein